MPCALRRPNPITRLPRIRADTALGLGVLLCIRNGVDLATPLVRAMTSERMQKDMRAHENCTLKRSSSQNQKNHT